ncbi:DoxX family protein [Flavobacterium sp.]|uniref:DoxX family protein n=1 Tax=Flavobacterium sp. TaxID=239 RepID=UPI00260D53F7|nr:DoxX family protein [Flavobacterium sp.]
MDKPWHLYVMAVFYILAGINHFRKPDVYYRIIPPILKNKKLINELSGLLEIMFGVYLFIPIFSNLAAISIIILLILIFPANIYMLINKKAGLGFPKWVLLLRLPLQLVLIYWASQYADFTKIV